MLMYFVVVCRMFSQCFTLLAASAAPISSKQAVSTPLLFSTAFLSPSDVKASEQRYRLLTATIQHHAVLQAQSSAIRRYHEKSNCSEHG